MKLIAWMKDLQPPTLLLLGLAVIFVGFALADRSILGLEPSMLAILAAVFAAVSSVYR